MSAIFGLSCWTVGFSWTKYIYQLFSKLVPYLISDILPILTYFYVYFNVLFLFLLPWPLPKIIRGHMTTEKTLLYKNTSHSNITQDKLRLSFGLQIINFIYIITLIYYTISFQCFSFNFGWLLLSLKQTFIFSTSFATYSYYSLRIGPFDPKIHENMQCNFQVSKDIYS